MIFEDIRVFLQIIASGSLSKAATAMNKPKASVSHHLKRLEDELDIPLFQRGANRLKLNQAGQDFLVHALAIRRACERGMDSALMSRQQIKGTINIASASSFASNLVAPVYEHFMVRHPDVRLSVMVLPQERLAEVREQYDCILYLGEPTLPQFSTMSARLLDNFKFGLFASETYLKRHGTPKTPSELIQHSLIGYRSGQSTTTWQLANDKEHFSVQPDHGFLSNDYWVIKLTSIHHHGICYLPTFFAETEEEAGRLTRVIPEWLSLNTPVYALYWSHRFSNPNLHALLDSMSDKFTAVYSHLYSAEAETPLDQ